MDVMALEAKVARMGADMARMLEWMEQERSSPARAGELLARA